MDTFEARYRLEGPWKQTAYGWVAKAEDLKLNREVIITCMSGKDDLQLQETMRWLSKASRFSDKRFLHVLDVVSEGGKLYAVLQGESGGLLSEKLHGIMWSGREMIERILYLASGLREARRERLPEFAVTADNIWLDGEGRLRFINYWTEGEARLQDIRGLSMLLYQLCSRSADNPPSMSFYYSKLRSVLTDLPGGSGDEAADCAGSAFNPSCTLREYENGWNRLLRAREAGMAVPLPNPASAKKGKKPVRSALGAAPSSPKPASPAAAASTAAFVKGAGSAAGRAAGSLSASLTPAPYASATGSAPHSLLWRPLAIAALGFGLFLLWVLFRPDDGNESMASHSLPTLSASPASGASASPSASQGKAAAAPAPVPSAVQGKNPALPSSASPSGKPAGAPNGSGTVVPDLTGRTKEEAEKLALQAGLHYQFLLEPNEMAKDRVFKQDPVPGTQVGKGEKIVFWVSKGK